MRAGSLTRKVTIQRQTANTSVDGAGLGEWTDLRTCRAEMRQQGGREFLTASGPSTEVRRVFFIRWFAGITAADRVLFEGSPHNIVEVREIGRRDGLELHAIANPFQVAG
ncbi:phage head closure protein [Sphingomonas aquatilis]|uniref:phage head closure protein n=1 Tax=Sphingomonas aquatilis TaxID=93063 RepID=UPI0023F8465A|nr:phage head closure protein [Sphingomonas aquatilis]MCI4653883.1 phage head closure protein [Sphingomonas aquatilis]